MIKKLKPKSEFSRNVLTLMTGTTVAQAIPIAISPILTRIYTPEDFGIFALFFAIISIFGAIANGRYELAIMLPQKDEDAINIFALGFIITVLLSLFLLIVILIFHDNIVNYLDNEKIGIWLYFVPFAVFFVGLFNILNYYNTRKKEYKSLANAKVIKSIILAVTQLSIGFIKQGAMGLITGQILSQIFANMRLFKNIIKNKTLLSHISKENIIKQAKRYKDFPKFSLWGIFANILSIQLTNILISSFFSVATLGFYSLVQKILGMPSALIGSSIGQVFFQEASQARQKHGNSSFVFRHTVKKLLLIGIMAFGILYFIVEDLFALVFGEEWRIAGMYAQIILPLFFIRFIYASVSTTYSIFNKLKLEFIWQITLLAGVISIIYIFKNDDFKTFLTFMCIYGVFLYLISLYLIFQLSKGDAKKGNNLPNKETR
jgi:O-antigen/teichoic acid export membrane protein